MRFFIADLKRGLTEPRFFLAVTLGLLCALVSGVVIGNGDSGYGFFTKSHSLILPFLMPLLCALPYSTMHMRERHSHFNRFMAIQLGQKPWILGRFFTNGLISGLTALLPGLSLVVASLLFDTTAYTGEVGQVLALNMAFGFAFGSLAYGLSFVNSQHYIPLIAPQVVYWFLAYALPILELEQYFPPLAYAPWILPGVASVGHSLGLLGVVSGVSLLLCCVGFFQKGVAL